ncbi:hypothetical protein [Marinobacter salarius]|uniref:hypothetical protein n=1 Tax=Marinobacter salarius TaxID=1420917 RepID=UPI003D0EC330
MDGNDYQRILAQRLVIDRLLYMTRLQPLEGQAMTVDEAVQEMLSECEGMCADERREIILRAAEAFKAESDISNIEATYEAITELKTEIPDTPEGRRYLEGWRRAMPLLAPESQPQRRAGKMRRVWDRVIEKFRGLAER